MPSTRHEIKLGSESFKCHIKCFNSSRNDHQRMRSKSFPSNYRFRLILESFFLSSFVFPSDFHNAPSQTEWKTFFLFHSQNNCEAKCMEKKVSSCFFNDIRSYREKRNSHWAREKIRKNTMKSRMREKSLIFFILRHIFVLFALRWMVGWCLTADVR